MTQVTGQWKSEEDKDFYDFQEDSKGECWRATATELLCTSKPGRRERGRDYSGPRTEPGS